MGGTYPAPSGLAVKLGDHLDPGLQPGLRYFAPLGLSGQRITRARVVRSRVAFPRALTRTGSRTRRKTTRKRVRSPRSEVRSRKRRDEGEVTSGERAAQPELVPTPDSGPRT